MRKIETQMNSAIRSRRDWHSGNTRVEITEDKTAIVYLHGNKIAVVDEENVQQYATNIYLYVGAVNYFLREPLNKINDKWDKAFEVGQAGGGSMNPQALMDAADAICKADESLDCSYAKTLISKMLLWKHSYKHL